MAPRRAIRCAMAIRDAVQSLGIQVRAGLHTGECEVRGDHGELVGAPRQEHHRPAARAGRPRLAPPGLRADRRLLRPIQRWVMAATELLAETPKVFLDVPCPSCGARFAYRRNGSGELVRTRALRVDEDGCTCLACSASWPPDRFEWLARLLGCPALPA
jgi:hypothetical protein